jgi:hypothetical protein
MAPDSLAPVRANVHITLQLCITDNHWCLCHCGQRRQSHANDLLWSSPCTSQQFVLPGECGLRGQKLMLKAHLVLYSCNQCVRLLRRLLHGKHVKGLTVLRSRTFLLGAVRPMLGTVPSSRAIPGKVAKHNTLPTFDRLARQHVEPTKDRYYDLWAKS